MHYSCDEQSSCLSYLRGYHPLWHSFPGNFNAISLDVHSTLHISHNFHCGIRFALFPLRSLLIRESRLFSFPPGTKMFQFPGYTFLVSCLAKNFPKWKQFLIRTSRDQSLHAAPSRLSQLATSIIAV